VDRHEKPTTIIIRVVNGFLGICPQTVKVGEKHRMNFLNEDLGPFGVHLSREK
jgi:hypothetical protein